jgi:hypothetical protein
MMWSACDLQRHHEQESVHPFSMGGFWVIVACGTALKALYLPSPPLAWGQRFQDDRGYGQVISATEF